MLYIFQIIKFFLSLFGGEKYTKTYYSISFSSFLRDTLDASSQDLPIPACLFPTQFLRLPCGHGAVKKMAEQLFYQ